MTLHDLLREIPGVLETEVGYSYVTSKDGFVYLLGNRRPDGSFFPPTGNPDTPFGSPPAPFSHIILGDNGLETKAQGGSKIYMSIAAPTLF